MLYQFDTPLEWAQLSKHLEAIDYRNEIVSISLDPKILLNNPDVKELLSSLEANIKPEWPHEISFQLLYFYEHNKYLLLEPDFHFNKYRLISLRADFYTKFSNTFDLVKFKNYCRTKQEEASKSGLRKGIWHSKAAEKIFGPSEDSGYFGGTGSSGWKYIALCNFFLDLYAEFNEIQLYRIAPYENLMLRGKLFSLNSLINSSDPLVIQAIQTFFVRKLDLPIKE